MNPGKGAGRPAFMGKETAGSEIPKQEQNKADRFEIYILELGLTQNERKRRTRVSPKVWGAAAGRMM